MTQLSFMAEKELPLDALTINVTEKALVIVPKTRWYHRDNLLSALRILSISVSLSVAILLLNLYVLPPLQIRDGIFLFLPAAAFLAWYFGYRAGLFMTFFASLLIAYFLLIPRFSFFHAGSEWLLLGLFILCSIITNFLIEKCKRPDIVEKYEKREREYQQLALKLHTELLHAKEEIKARDEFLSIASHELKTPLTAMLLQLQTVLHNIRNVSLANFSVDNLLRMLDSAEQQSKRLSKMINDLLNVSLITTGKMDLEKESMDLTETLKDLIERFSEKAKKEDTHLRLSTEDHLKGMWDKLRIEQAVSNLLTNAMKYGKGKPVLVKAHKNGSTIELSVQDHGIGIPEAKKDKIFVRFERAVAKQSFEGLGVGLYITKQIVAAHNGKIHVDSKEGKGSTFTIILPVR